MVLIQAAVCVCHCVYRQQVMDANYTTLTSRHVRVNCLVCNHAESARFSFVTISHPLHLRTSESLFYLEEGIQQY